MDSEKMTACETCGAEIAASAKTCPHCGAKNKVKKPVYKRPWFWILIVAVVIFMLPDTRTESKPNPAYETMTQKEKAESTYRKVSTSVLLAEDRLTKLSEYINGLESEYTVLDLYDYCKLGVKNCRGYIDMMDDVADPKGAEDYIQAASVYIYNVQSAHQKMQDYIDSGKVEDLSSFNSCWENVSGDVSRFIVAQDTYLKDSGLTADEIDELIGIEDGQEEGQSTDTAQAEDSEPSGEEEISLPNWTTSQKNAMAKAKNYLDYTAFSYTGLVEQLEYEKFSHEDAVWAADNCNADWNEQAVLKARSYLDYTAFSYSGLVEQLEYEGFTAEQATYGADNCEADWSEQAALKAKSYLDYSSFSRQGLIDQLLYEGFTQEQAEYGVSQNGY